MSSKDFIEQLTEMAPRVPDQAEVLALRRLSVDEVHARDAAIPVDDRRRVRAHG